MNHRQRNDDEPDPVAAGAAGACRRGDRMKIIRRMGAALLLGQPLPEVLSAHGVRPAAMGPARLRG